MKFELLVPWWGLIPFVIVPLVALWQLWRVRHKGKLIVLRWVRRSALLLLLLLMAAGPSVPGGSSSIGTANLDIIFAVDVTPSMGALDYNGASERMDGVREDLMAIASKLEGARFEIITFDSAPNLVLPFTNDRTAFQSAVEGLLPDVNTYSKGTSLDKPIKYISQELDHSKSSNPDRKRLLFFISDGEETLGTKGASFAPIQSKLSGGAVLGYGTAKGAQVVKYASPGLIPELNEFVLTVNPDTQKLEPVISKMDAGRLEEIAKQLGVSYQDRNEGGPIDNLYNASRAPLAVDDSQRIIHYFNLYWLVAMPLLFLVFWEWRTLVITMLQLRQKRKGKGRRRA